MVKRFIKARIAKHRDLILREGDHLSDFMKILMKRRNDGGPWTGEEKDRLKSYLRRLSLYVPVLVVFLLPFGMFLLPILAEVLDRRAQGRRD